MGFFSFLSVLSPIHIQCVTLLSGSKKIGQDNYGNTYYQGKMRKGYKHPRRWVMYKGTPEPSLVPPEWHGWLHHQVTDPPQKEAMRRPWMKQHEPNKTGTTAAYRPPGHILSGGQRDKATGDYEAWTPE